MCLPCNQRKDNRDIGDVSRHHYTQELEIGFLIFLFFVLLVQFGETIISTLVRVHVIENLLEDSEEKIILKDGMCLYCSMTCTHGDRI